MYLAPKVTWLYGARSSQGQEIWAVHAPAAAHARDADDWRVAGGTAAVGVLQDEEDPCANRLRYRGTRKQRKPATGDDNARIGT